MATIKKIERKKGTVYKITVLLGTDSSGKQIRESTTYTPESTTPAKIEKEVQRFANEYEEKVRNGMVLSGEKLTLEAYCKLWLEEQEKHLAMGTYDYYKDFIDRKLVPALGFYKMSDVKAKHIKSFVANLRGKDGQPLKPSSVRKDLAVVKSIFKTAWLDEVIQAKPAERVTPPKQTNTEEKLKHFNHQQAKTFFALLDCGLEYKYSARMRKDSNGTEYSVKAYTSKHPVPMQMKVFFCIALFSGCRKGEILALDWSDIDFDEAVISISKSVSYSNGKVLVKSPKTVSSVRKVRVPAEVINLIREYRKEWLQTKLALGSAWQGSNNLFIQDTGKLMHPSTPYHTFTKLIKQYNSTVEDESMKLPLIPLHGLRHTSATLLIANDINVPTVTKILGHSNINTTLDFYVHPLEELDKQAADTMKTYSLRKKHNEKIM